MVPTNPQKADAGHPLPSLHSRGRWIFCAKTSAANMSYLLAVFLQSFRTWNKHDSFPAIFSNRTFSKNITSLPTKHHQFFMVFSSGEKTSIWGPKMGNSFVLLLFRPQNEVGFPSRNRQFLDGCSTPKNVSCFAWVWRQSIASSGKVFGSVFLLVGKIFPKRKTCLDIVFCSQKSIGHSCVIKHICCTRNLPRSTVSAP